MLQTLEINPDSAPCASVIWMHGLGASGHDFYDIVPLLNLPQEFNVRFVFPNAPIRPVQYADGMEVRAWFDVIALDKNAKIDEQGIRDSEKLIGQLIERELAQNIPSEKIVLIGFSQGGAMALQCGLRYPEKLAGVLSLSAWLPLPQKVVAEKSEANAQIPIAMMHGTHDDLIPIEWAKESCDYLKSFGYKVEFTSYPMQHEVCLDEINAIGKILRNLLV